MENFFQKTKHFLFYSHLIQKIRKICKYCISGGTGAVIDFFLYSLLIYFFSTYYLVSNFISFSCGTLATYYLQKNWTFQYKTNNNISVFKRFILAVIGTYILNNILLILFVNIVNINVFSAKILQIIISTIWGYTVNSTFVFIKKD